MNPLRAHLCSAARRSSHEPSAGTAATALPRTVRPTDGSRKPMPRRQLRGGRRNRAEPSGRAAMSLFGTQNHSLEIPDPKCPVPNPNTKLALEVGIWDLGFAYASRNV